jgi:hypothetical protein
LGSTLKDAGDIPSFVVVPSSCSLFFSARSERGSTFSLANHTSYSSTNNFANTITNNFANTIANHISNTITNNFSHSSTNWIANYVSFIGTSICFSVFLPFSVTQ